MNNINNMNKYLEIEEKLKVDLENIKYRIYLFVNEYWEELYNPLELNLREIVIDESSEDEEEYILETTLNELEE